MIARAADTVAIGAGVVLGGVFRLLGSVPGRSKPLHPRGRVVRATLTRHGLHPVTGVEFLDTARVDEVLLRESRSIGLPQGFPDVSGLAMRVIDPDGRVGDLLFSSTGLGRVSRYVLTPSLTTYGRPMTTLIPYRTTAGPVLLGIRRVADRTLSLSCSVDGGPWLALGDVEVSDDLGDQDVSFDPVLHLPPGLEQYDVVRLVREPAYRGARASRE